eukprot:3652035-Amphidinium_carterae.3
MLRHRTRRRHSRVSNGLTTAVGPANAQPCTDLPDTCLGPGGTLDGALHCPCVVDTGVDMLSRVTSLQWVNQGAILDTSTHCPLRVRRGRDAGLGWYTARHVESLWDHGRNGRRICSVTHIQTCQWVNSTLGSP